MTRQKTKAVGMPPTEELEDELWAAATDDDIEPSGGPLAPGEAVDLGTEDMADDPRAVIRVDDEPGGG